MNHNEAMHLLTVKTADRLRLANVWAMIAETPPEVPEEWRLAARHYEQCASALLACAYRCNVNAAKAEARLERLALRRKQTKKEKR
jgi:hypothetical protein